MYGQHSSAADYAGGSIMGFITSLVGAIAFIRLDDVIATLILGFCGALSGLIATRIVKATERHIRLKITKRKRRWK